jgi:Plasmid pRiA4b ORF-3-like protein
VRTYGKMTAMANTRRIKPGASTAPARTVHTIKVTLAGSQPPIWRRLQVPSTITLRALHDVLQAAFGWEDYHMWVFETPIGRYGLPDRELEISSAAAKRLDQVAPHKTDRLGYTYDFGDDWEHIIAVETITSPEPGIAYPRCLTGRRACRPKTAAASGATTTSSRSSPTPSTKNTKNGSNGSASTQPTSSTPQPSTPPRQTPRWPAWRPSLSKTDHPRATQPSQDQRRARSRSAVGVLGHRAARNAAESGG